MPASPATAAGSTAAATAPGAAPVRTARANDPGALALGPGEHLTLVAFAQLSSQLAGIPYVKLVVDRTDNSIHFIDSAVHQFHANFIGETWLGLTAEQVDARIDELNQQFYFDLNRRYCLGVLALHRPRAQGGEGGERPFFSLETVEVDAMDESIIRQFYSVVKAHVDPAVPVFFKPANHHQEAILAAIDTNEVPRLYSHEIFATSQYVPLNPGKTRGRLRAFPTPEAYATSRATLEWYDIIVMHRVPDDIPRVSGIINASHTTPLSHTNVLASGWQIPNSIQLGIFDRIGAELLDGAWVEYAVVAGASELSLSRIERPSEVDHRPAWSVQKIKLEEPETVNVPIVPLADLRMSDRYRYGTKAANLGELAYVLRNGSDRLAGFYRVKRPPRASLIPYLAKYLGCGESPDEVSRAAGDFVRANVQIPRGVAIPFSVQQEFLESSPKVQQTIGKLKMALELGAREIDALCVSLQQQIRATRMPARLRESIDRQVANHLAGVSSFVVRSSSNAEDLENFSAAGIYESINHVTTADRIFDGIREVWASLLSPRSVRLRNEVGISLDDSYMGVIVQEEIPGAMGGVLVTTNPINRGDFRNVYFNLSPSSVVDVVQGSREPYQYLFNTVEGGGRTLSIGSATSDLPATEKARLQRLAFIGRLLQSHFAPDYTFSAPVDIEWLAPSDGSSGVFILQLRPFAK